MPEIYNLKMEQGKLSFEASAEQAPQWQLLPTFQPQAPEKDLHLVCRMGDPDLMQCIVYKRDAKAGGIFAMHGKNGVLFIAYAEIDLVFAMAMGYFGELTANARYGVDVFENLEEPND